MKLKLEDVLKHGAKMVVKKIDFNDSEVKRLLEQTCKDIRFGFNRYKD